MRQLLKIPARRVIEAIAISSMTAIILRVLDHLLPPVAPINKNKNHENK